MVDLQQAPLEDVERELDASAEGLSSDEVRRRLQRDGPNAVAEQHTNAFVAFLKFFWGPIPWMIEVALVLAAILGDWNDVVVIAVLLLMNGIVGWWEEHQAGNAIAALKKRLAASARVRRDSSWGECDAADLVVGDVIRVRLGDVVPADARILKGELELDQSSLTGESLPVKQQDGGIAYSGTVTTKGEADALVVATGTRTFFGRTAQLVETAGTVSHFQRAVLGIGRYLIMFAVAFVVVTLVAGLLRGNDAESMIEFALVLTIAGVPVALPAVLSVTMAVGAGHLAKRDVVVSHLPAVEEIGGVDILCSDKTGTLTQNKLQVSDPRPITVQGAVSIGDLLGAAALASRAEDRDPIDLAVLAAAADQTPPFHVTDFTPFDPVTKRSEALCDGSDGELRFTKGAPQAVFGLLAADDPHHDDVDQAVQTIVDDLASRGYRALGVAKQPDGGSWQYLGILPLADPPRADSRATLDAARDLGVDVKMVTGDNLAIAKEVASEVGLGTDILDARSLGTGDGSSSTEKDSLTQEVEQADGFAQVFPEHKYRIVDALQHGDHIVGMTGDGVNDAPALKQADAGIAVSGATDAARAAADIVLLTPGLSVIIEAIRKSREIFERMKSYTLYRICETIALVVFVAIAVVVSNDRPVTAIMILLLAVLNDGAILSIAYDHQIAGASPESWEMKPVLTVATVLGAYVVCTSLLLFLVGDAFFDLSIDELRTLVYLKLSVAGHLTVFCTRTRGPFWSVRPAGVLLGAVLGTQALATLIATLGLGLVTAIPWYWAAAIWGYAIIGFLIQDRIKLATYWYLERTHQVPAAAT